MGIAAYISLLITILPKIIELIKLIEKVFPGKGLGVEKLAIATSAISPIINGQLKESGVDILTIQNIINGAVTILNKNGWISTSGFDPEMPPARSIPG